MSKGMVLVGIIILGVLTLAVVNIVQNYQTGNELDYYLLEETTEAAMLDAVDPSYYRISGIIRMDREKFLESFVRRFAENVNRDRNYKVRILDSKIKQISYQYKKIKNLNNPRILQKYYEQICKDKQISEIKYLSKNNL